MTNAGVVIFFKAVPSARASVLCKSTLECKARNPPCQLSGSSLTRSTTDLSLVMSSGISSPMAKLGKIREKMLAKNFLKGVARSGFIITKGPISTTP
eukprot:02170.XXX_282_572_1 [CDS] Oithona nana genome sequencing.